MNRAPGLDRDVEIGRREHAAVDQLPALDLHRLVDHRQGAGGGDRPGDRDVIPALRAEHDPLAGIEVGRGDVQVAAQQPKIVAAIGIGQDRPHVPLDSLGGVQAGGQRVSQPDGEIHGRYLSQVPDQRADQQRQPPGQLQSFAHELGVVGLQQRVDAGVRKRRRDLLHDHPHHLLGRDAVRHRGGDQRAGTGPDVDVELVDRAIHREQIERPERADLVDAPGEAAASEHERRARSLAAAAGCRVARAGGGALGPGGVELDDLAHASAIVGRGRCSAPQLSAS